MDNEKVKKSKHFCSAIWGAIYQAPNGNIGPCCVYNGSFGNIQSQTLDDMYKSDKVAEVKRKMLNDEKVEECNYCYGLEGENQTSTSGRTSFNKTLFNKLDLKKEEPEFIYWDIRITNLCNFKCRMCNPELSSEWKEDWAKLGLEDTQDKVITVDRKNRFFSDLQEHYKYVKHIYFAGGEPFLSSQHYKILDDLRSLNLEKQVEIRVNTNLSIRTYKKKRVLDYYEGFDNVFFGFSIDGSYGIGEYIRKGLNYTEWKENVKEYVEYTEKCNNWSITYGFQITYGAMNFHNLFDFILDLYDSNLINKFCKFQFQPIQDPEEQSLKALPTQVVKDCIDRLKTIEQKLKEVDEIVLDTLRTGLEEVYIFAEASKHSPELTDSLFSKAEELDKIRDESIFEHLPDYRKM